MKYGVKIWSATLFVVVGIQMSLLAEDASGSTDEGDEFGQVKVLEDKKYSLTKRFSADLGISFQPLDAFYKPLLLTGGASYQFNDHFSWDFVRVGYSLANLDTGLKSDIELKAAREGVAFEFDPLVVKSMRYMVASEGFWNALYSKSNFMNKHIVYQQWQLGGGPIFYDYDTEKQYGIDLAVRARFFVNEQWNINIRGSHSFGFSSGAPKNVSDLGLGVGIAF